MNRDVAASTQNQAFNAIMFLYKKVLDIPMELDIRAKRTSKRKNLPTVLRILGSSLTFDIQIQQCSSNMPSKWINLVKRS